MYQQHLDDKHNCEELIKLLFEKPFLENNDERGNPLLPSRERFYQTGGEVYGFSISQLDKMFNVHVKMLSAMTEVLDNQNLLKLQPDFQKYLIELCCGYLNNQMKDLRLRKERSNIMRGVHYGMLKYDESNLNPTIYFYLQIYLRWERNFLDYYNLHNRFIEANKIHKDLRAILMRDSDQYFKMIFQITKQEGQNDNEEESKGYGDNNRTVAFKEDLVPEFMKKSRKYIQHNREMSIMIFFRLLQYYEDSEISKAFVEQGGPGSSQNFGSRQSYSGGMYSARNMN